MSKEQERFDRHLEAASKRAAKWPAWKRNIFGGIKAGKREPQELEVNDEPLENREPSLLVKLGSIAVHAKEMLSPSGHELDRVVITELLRDKEVQEWIKAMNKYGLLPVLREPQEPEGK